MSFENVTLSGETVDELVQAGIHHIQQNGEDFTARAGSGLQAFGVAYVLENPLARVHTLRAPTTTTYFANELFAYLRGSLHVDDGLGQAAPFWRTLCDEEGKINSNYGYYTFHQLTPEGSSQFDWVRACFRSNRDTRKAFININGIEHKTPTYDYPCTLGMQFHIRNGAMNCDVATRSADVVTGLPYDMGFFSLVNELMAQTVSLDLGEEVQAGYTAMRATFTQIYDRTAHWAADMLSAAPDRNMQRMPAISDPYTVLEDIASMSRRLPTSEAVRWVYDNSPVYRQVIDRMLRDEVQLAVEKEITDEQ